MSAHIKNAELIREIKNLIDAMEDSEAFALRHRNKIEAARRAVRRAMGEVEDSTLQLTLSEAEQNGDELNIGLWYPDYDGKADGDRINKIVLALYAVRAASDIRVSYDFQRDGWKVEQCYEGNEEHPEPEWKETAFAPAWPFDEPADTSC